MVTRTHDIYTEITAEIAHFRMNIRMHGAERGAVSSRPGTRQAGIPSIARLYSSSSSTADGSERVHGEPCAFLGACQQACRTT
jgi:hypothetical protein